MSEFGTEILIFAGTTEGRELAEHLAGAGVRCTVSVATEYGAQILGPGKGRTVLQGRLTQEQMEFLIREEDFTCVVDATHPFATEVSAQIRKACEETKVPYLRLARDTEGELPDGGFGIYEAASMQEAAKILRGIPGNLFLTTGSKDLPLEQRPASFGRRDRRAPKIVCACAAVGRESEDLYGVRDSRRAPDRHAGSFHTGTQRGHTIADRGEGSTHQRERQSRRI